MKILVTGGAGFIASQIVDLYIGSGHEVTIVDNLISGFKANLNAKARFVQADISNPQLKEVFENESFDLINHHASQIDVRKSLENPFYDMQVNIAGSLNILELMNRYKVPKIIYASSGGAIHGDPDALPLTEASRIQPICHYGVSKYAVENYLHLYAHLYNIQFTVLRYPNVYGPRQNPFGEGGVNAIFIGKMLKGEIPHIYGDGKQLRDFIFVQDVAQANLLALDQIDNSIYNVATNDGRSVNDIYQVLQGITGITSKPIYEEARLGEIQKTYMSADKIKEAWGWEATVNLEEGLQKTLDWFKEEGMERFF